MRAKDGATRAACGWAALAVAAMAAAAGCGGSDVSSFGEGPGGGGGGTAGTESTSDATTSAAGTTTGSASGTGGSGSGASDPGTTVGTGGAGQGGAGQGGGGPSCGDDSCDEPESCESCAEDCGECPETCGNDACDAGETCESCQDDCGPCEPDCVEHTDCSSDDLCIGGTCESAYGRTYVFTVVDGFLPITDPGNGTEWDPVGLPDPFVQICNESICPAGTTTTKDEQNAPVWNESFSVQFSGPGDEDVWFLMWDEDIADDDFALQTPVGSPAEWVDIVRTEGGTYVHEASPGLDLRIDVSPL